jgi:hypothetical protein
MPGIIPGPAMAKHRSGGAGPGHRVALPQATGHFAGDQLE